MQSPSKYQWCFFAELEQIILKCVWNNNRLQTATVIVKKKTKVGGIMLPDSKLYHQAIVVKTTW